MVGKPRFGWQTMSDERYSRDSVFFILRDNSYYNLNFICWMIVLRPFVLCRVCRRPFAFVFVHFPPFPASLLVRVSCSSGSGSPGRRKGLAAIDYASRLVGTRLDIKRLVYLDEPSDLPTGPSLPSIAALGSLDIFICFLPRPGRRRAHLEMQDR